MLYDSPREGKTKNSWNKLDKKKGAPHNQSQTTEPKKDHWVELTYLILSTTHKCRAIVFGNDKKVFALFCPLLHAIYLFPILKLDCLNWVRPMLVRWVSSSRASWRNIFLSSRHTWMSSSRGSFCDAVTLWWRQWQCGLLFPSSGLTHCAADVTVAGGHRGLRQPLVTSCYRVA